VEFVTAEREFEELFKKDDATEDSWILFSLGLSFPGAEDPLAALQEADVSVARAAAAKMLRQTPLVVCSAGFDVRRGRGREPEVVARWRMDTLDDALRWMVWRDVECKQPISSCPECGKMFRPDSKRWMKYCSYACAHRVAARLSARKQRAKSKRPIYEKRRKLA
jgi:hypothetical protein